MQNEGQQLRTTSSTKNEFKHRESHQGPKNTTIHKDQITNQRPKPIPIRKQLTNKIGRTDKTPEQQPRIINKEQDQEQRKRHKLNTTKPKDKRQQHL